MNAPRFALLAKALAALGLAMPLVATRGFTAFTTDTARAQDVERSPRSVPSVRFLSADSLPQQLLDGPAKRARIVGFIATRCVTLCAQQNGVFQQLQREVIARGWQDRLELVTISFDPSWDTPRALRYFTLAQRPDARVWRVLTFADSTALAPVLRTFGIRVIREGTDLVHNAALHVVSPEGALVAIVPMDATEDALQAALRLVPARDAARVPPP